MVHYFGSHMHNNNLIKSAKKVKSANGNILQIFLTIPGDDKTRQRNIDDLHNFKKYLEKNNMKVVVHSSYLHNLCRPWDEYSWWLKNLELEIKYSHEIGAIGVVLHLGKQLNFTLEEAYNNMYTSLIYLHHKTKEYSDVQILLETPTGQGTQICYKIDDFAKFYKKISCNPNKEIRKRLKICIDSCHIFTAGYDIRTKNKIKNYLETFNELIGLKHIKLVHLNDSKIKLGGLVDRHQNIGSGYIGFEALKCFFDIFRDLNIPVVLETPGDGYITEIKLLSE
jgi:deoxyribonuclease-4